MSAMFTAVNFFCLLALVSGTYLDCFRMCPQPWYEPVCAKETGAQFRNLCEFQIAQCVSGNQLTSIPCPELSSACPNECSADPEPVCAKETGEKFNNLCHLQVAACSSDTNLTPVQCGCVRGCSMIYDPVCAKETGEWYRNACLMEFAACQAFTEFTPIPCSETA